ncbi:hypothetical protein N752_07635 [Desulforamulus aquiferis]|nr:hypothetical protein [Desulforamulus aquiferis]RYD05756.1 hypothetical protein N752_07635 [Desulforamulus aquiferis]
MNKLNTCCFTGHRKLPKEKIEHIIKRLNHEIDNLISKGVTNFISGGSFGFEQVAASLIIAKKEMGRGVRLILQNRINFGVQSKGNSIIIYWQKLMRLFMYWKNTIMAV